MEDIKQESLSGKQESAQVNEVEQKTEGISTEPKKKTLNDAVEIAFEKAKAKSAQNVDNKKSQLDKKADRQDSAQTKTQKTTQLQNVEKLEPVQTWSDEQKQFFARLNNDDKKAVLKHYGDWESGYRKKFSEVDSDVKLAKSFREVMTPLNQQLKQLGIDPITKVKDLLALEYTFVSNPERFIADAINAAMNSGRAKRENILKLLGLSDNQTETAEQNPAYFISQLEQKLDQKLNSFEGRLRQDKVDKIDSEILEFFSQKDESGNLKYPHFEKLEESMAKISQLTGETDLEKLYQKAVLLDPELSKDYVDNIAKTKLETLQKEKDLEKAKTASMNLNNSPNANVNITKKRTLSEIIDDNYNSIK